MPEYTKSAQGFLVQARKPTPVPYWYDKEKGAYCFSWPEALNVMGMPSHLQLGAPPVVFGDAKSIATAKQTSQRLEQVISRAQQLFQGPLELSPQQHAPNYRPPAEQLDMGL